MEREENQENESEIESLKKDKIEQLIEEKVEQKTKKLKKQNQKLRKEIKQIKKNSKHVKDTENNKEKEISRREFLKKAGIGALGLGAASLMPSASALDVKSDSLEVFTGTGENSLTEYFSVGQGGPVNIQNTNLNLNKNYITNLADPNNNQDAATKKYVDNNTGNGSYIGYNTSHTAGGNLDMGGNQISNINQLQLPTASSSNNNRIWIDETNKKLQVRIEGNVYTAASPPILDTYESQYYTSGSDVIEEELGSTMEGASYGEVDWENSGNDRNSTLNLYVRVNGSYNEVGSVPFSNVSASSGTETFSFSAVDCDAAKAECRDNKINPVQFRVATDSSKL